MMLHAASEPAAGWKTTYEALKCVCLCRNSIHRGRHCIPLGTWVSWAHQPESHGRKTHTGEHFVFFVRYPGLVLVNLTRRPRHYRTACRRVCVSTRQVQVSDTYLELLRCVLQQSTPKLVAFAPSVIESRDCNTFRQVCRVEQGLYKSGGRLDAVQDFFL